MKMNDDGILPLIAILVILGIGLLLVGWVIVALTMKSMIAILLVGAGVYLFIRPSATSGMGSQAKIAIPLVLIVLGVLFYAGVFDGFL